MANTWEELSQMKTTGLVSHVLTHLTDRALLPPKFQLVRGRKAVAQPREEVMEFCRPAAELRELRERTSAVALVRDAGVIAPFGSTSSGARFADPQRELSDEVALRTDCVPSFTDDIAAETLVMTRLLRVLASSDRGSGKGKGNDVPSAGDDASQSSGLVQVLSGREFRTVPRRVRVRPPLPLSLRVNFAPPLQEDLPSRSPEALAEEGYITDEGGTFVEAVEGHLLPSRRDAEAAGDDSAESASPVRVRFGWSRDNREQMRSRSSDTDLIPGDIEATQQRLHALRRGLQNTDGHAAGRRPRLDGSWGPRHTILATLAHLMPGGPVWRARVPNGRYLMRITLGDCSFPTVVRLQVNGVAVTQNDGSLGVDTAADAPADANSDRRSRGEWSGISLIGEDEDEEASLGEMIDREDDDEDDDDEDEDEKKGGTKRKNRVPASAHRKRSRSRSTSSTTSNIRRSSRTSQVTDKFGFGRKVSVKEGDEKRLPPPTTPKSSNQAKRASKARQLRKTSKVATKATSKVATKAKRKPRKVKRKSDMPSVNGGKKKLSKKWLNSINAGWGYHILKGLGLEWVEDLEWEYLRDMPAFKGTTIKYGHRARINRGAKPWLSKKEKETST